MARAHGIEAFCYYHYWFAGKRLIERPFNEVLASGEPDLPFCLCWANQTWTGIWHGAPNRILIEQTYPGMDDHARHFDFLVQAFMDRRHVRVDGKPLFMVYEPTLIPDVRKVTDFWRDRAAKAGLPGLHLVGWRHATRDWDPEACGFDASSSGLPRYSYGWREPVRKIGRMIGKKLGRPMLYDYADVEADLARAAPADGEHYPCVIPNWDNTPRSGANGLVLTGATPELFRRQLRAAIERADRLPAGRRIVFVKSWNEWAEGNHLEPDLKCGRALLDVVRDEVDRARGGAAAGR